METLSILHISDLHIGNFRYEDPATLAIKIADTLLDRGKRVELVLVSGDVFDGRSNAYAADKKTALMFFQVLHDQLKIKNICHTDFDKNSILILPGNHDLLRKLGNAYERYDAFVHDYYGGKQSNKVQLIDDYNFICAYPEKKIAVLGFNSCRIELDSVKKQELEWINKLDLSKFGKAQDKIKKIINDDRGSVKKWDDFGYVNALEMDHVFTTLRETVPDYADYTLLASFHHHFYPFPEIVNKFGDTSYIRNYTVVMDKFQMYKIQLVLHGHKHLSIQRAITDNKYFSNPDSIIYVLSAGSIGSKDVYNPSFQWIRVHDKNSTILVDGEKYDFKDEELASTTAILLPPQAQDEKSYATQLLDALQKEDSKLYSKYLKITDDFEQIILDNKTKEIIEVISSLITVFQDINKELSKSPDLIYTLLLALNYRVIFLSELDKQSEDKHSILEKLRLTIKDYFKNKTFAGNLIHFLSSITNSELDANYLRIIKNVLVTEKRHAAYISVTLFLTDLFLNISQYGEHYFEREKLNHKINIKLRNDLFYKNIPSDSISLKADIDRRAIILCFKCKDPTVHKVAVLIAKDFEMRLNRFEESLKEIKLKLYYVLPKVIPDKYDLENFHFDAYIPTLLPLLTGENLYKQKEVFIRELVQNSIDATLLRRKLQPTLAIDSSIYIEMGSENRNNSAMQYFRIIDNGIGMSKFTIERYFTSIGRSFYVSEEFDEIKKAKNIRFDAISNFGIGFLSSFMVCQEILVKTKNVIDDGENDGLEIEIPNYDGCFFIRKINLDRYGTEITLYEDERSYFKIQKFISYIKSTLLSLPIDIHVTFSHTPQDNFVIPAYSLHKKFLHMVQDNKSLIFYVPFDEVTGQIKNLKYDKLHNSTVDELDKFGVFFDIGIFNLHAEKQKALTANQGLKISESQFLYQKDTFSPNTIINYPSSFIQLDVAREKITRFKRVIPESSIKSSLLTQIKELLKTVEINKPEITLFELNAIRYLQFEIPNTTSLNPIFALKISNANGLLNISIVNAEEVPDTYDYKRIAFLTSFPYFVNEHIDQFIRGLGKIDLKPAIKKAIRTKKAAKDSEIARSLIKSFEGVLLQSGYSRRHLRRGTTSGERAEFAYRAIHEGEYRLIEEMAEIFNPRHYGTYQSSELLNEWTKNKNYSDFFYHLWCACSSLIEERVQKFIATFTCLLVLKQVIFISTSVAEYAQFNVTLDLRDWDLE